MFLLGRDCSWRYRADPDSVALLHALKGMSYPIMVGHVDHGLRKNSSRDARFVQRLARRWDIPCVVKRENVRAYARTHAQGLEEAAREVRYRALAAIARKAKCSVIITAHTADDQAEDCFDELSSGELARVGLSGMPVRRDLNHGSYVLFLSDRSWACEEHRLMAYLKNLLASSA